MKILHTSDWHLGKTLEGFSRLDEQVQFLDELISIADTYNVDLVLVAGDVYDGPNPTASAEKLFYDSIKKLARGGERAILVIAGNHDNPERLMAASPLAYEHGVILLGKPKSIAVKGELGKYYIEDAGQGYVKLQIRGERAVILTLPYPSEKRLKEILLTEEYGSDDTGSDKDNACVRSYAERVGEIFQELAKHYSEDTINLAVSHLYITGGEESDSERQIQLGGSLAVDAGRLPEAQYIALGHLHRPQKVKGTDKKAFYSGSPLQYSKSEINYSKCVYIIDVTAGEEAEVEEVLLHNYKPIEIWKCESIDAALQRCQEQPTDEKWIYLDINTDRVLTQAEIKEIKSLCSGIVQIRPIFTTRDDWSDQAIEDYKSFKIDELFKAFYSSQKSGAQAPAEIMDLFYQIAGEGGVEDEAYPTQG